MGGSTQGVVVVVEDENHTDEGCGIRVDINGVSKIGAVLCIPFEQCIWHLSLVHICCIVVVKAI